MKRKLLTVLMALIAALCLCFALAACDNGGNGGEGGNSGSEQGTTKPDEGGTTKPDEGGTTKPDEGGSTKPDGGGTTKPDQGGTTKPDEGGTTKPDEGGTTKPDEGGTTKPDEGGEQKPDEGGEETPEEHVHSFTNYVYNNDATCTDDGTETATCSCGKTDTRTKKNTALGHDMQPVAAQEPTCTEIGWDAYEECSRCQKKENFAEKKALGHKYTVKNVCSVCNDKWNFTDDLIYELDPDSKTYNVARNPDATGDVVIPYGHEGKWVTGIRYSAFYRCKGLTSITISPTV